MTHTSDLPQSYAFLFPPKKTRVDAWKPMLEARIGTNSLLEEFFLKTLHYYKCSKGTEHEFVIAEIRRRNHDNEVHFLRLERASGHSKLHVRIPSDPSTQSFQDSISSRATMGSTSVSRASSQNFDAVDTVVEVDSSSDELMYTITFQDSNDHVLPLMDLAIAADVAHNLNEHYQLGNAQCYWWADTLVAILEGQVDPKYRTKQERNRDSKGGRCRKEGSFRLIRQFVPIQIHERDLKTDYAKMFKDSKAEVENLYRQRVSDLPAERQRRLEAEDRERAAEEKVKKMEQRILQLEEKMRNAGNNAEMLRA
ncbi:hypothetical protein H0H81_000832 [Sphagnurus paluster]|uniref:Uncharacterized protein n=1 Tax=Sphagnurus paluster TaxID=117069 RepID=A0A9P7GGA1_9AGAR|nr:hypothetical protein H0H81_000832 [Sphagnurus paluster]